MRIHLWGCLVAVVIALTASSCTTKGGRDQETGGYKPVARGLPYELVMVVPRGLYTGELKDSLDAVLLGSTPVLPQHEPLFRLDVAYTDSNLTAWRTFRNRLIVETDVHVKEPQMGVARNVMARGQIEVKVSARTAHELAEFISVHRQRLTDLFVEHELEYEAENLRRRHDPMTGDSLKALCGHTICVPPAFRASKVARDFLWTGTNLNDKDQNFIYYTYPWDGLPLTPERFAEKHDSVLRANVPGARSGQWMQTARSDGKYLLLARTRTLKNKVVQQVHGLWELRAGALGGPFVALEQVDTTAGRVVVVEGFVYSPHSPKRDILRQMESALRTFE